MAPVFITVLVFIAIFTIIVLAVVLVILIARLLLEAMPLRVGGYCYCWITLPRTMPRDKREEDRGAKHIASQGQIRDQGRAEDKDDEHRLEPRVARNM